MTEEPAPTGERLTLSEARDLTRCYGHHRAQSLAYALNYCLQCRKLKTCVRASWGVDRPRPWRKADWWPETAPVKPAKSKTRSRAARRPINIS